MAGERSRTLRELPAQTRPQLTLASLQGLRGVFQKTRSSRLSTIFATEWEGAVHQSGSTTAGPSGS
jgi:hypothetical protein